jgi:hypothetical protein
MLADYPEAPLRHPRGFHPQWLQMHGQTRGFEYVRHVFPLGGSKFCRKTASRDSEKGFATCSPEEPESVVRFADVVADELSPGAEFRDLFAGRFGAVGICGGYGRFLPECSLPCHTHMYDESITIVEGEAACLVAGKEYFA